MMPIIISYIYKFVSFNMYEAANNATENSHTEDQDYLTLTVTINHSPSASCQTFRMSLKRWKQANFFLSPLPHICLMCP